MHSIPAFPYGKGRCHGVTEGIRKSVFDKVNRKAESIRKKDVTCYVLFALVRNGNKVKRAAGERGKKPAVSRTARRR